MIRNERTLTLWKIGWPLATVALLVALEALRRTVLPGIFDGVGGMIVLLAIWTIIMAVGAHLIMGAMARSNRLLLRQNRELLALHHASLEIESEIELERVLRRIVAEAKGVLSAHYGGLTYFRDSGEIAQFITLGWEHPEGAVPNPVGHGVIGAVTREGGVLHLEEVHTHPQSVGYPDGHPDMRPLLAVPIRSKDSVFGNLYLANDGGQKFDVGSEETLERFAALAAVAIENANLHQQVRVMAITEERERIAREMHDSLAQVLGYVNTKVQATSVLLETGRIDDATRNLDQMGQAARSAYADVREGILSLRTSLQEDRGLVDTIQEYLNLWEDQSGVHAALDADATAQEALSDLAEVQLLRIVQEALSNVRKHANATTVVVSLQREDGRIVTRVADNGQGIVASTRPTFGVPQFGMSTMRERAEALGGTLEIDTRANEGTTIIVRLPAGAQNNSGARI
jgi:nitrate/nitrite-specific signal transduction histidine kinase